MGIKSSVIKKCEEYFQFVEELGYLIQAGTNLTFSNGEKIDHFWKCNAETIYNCICEPKNKKQYPKAYHIIYENYNNGKVELSDFEKIIVCFKKLEDDFDIFNDKKVKFENGHRIYSFITRNLSKAYKLILQDNNYKTYPKAYQSIIKHQKETDKVLRHCDEYFPIVEKEKHLIKSTDKRLFSDGGQMRLFWPKNRDKIYSIICQENYRIKYPKTYTIMTERYNYTRLTREQRFDEYFKIIETKKRLLTTSDKDKFSDGIVAYGFINFHYSEMVEYLNKEFNKSKYPNAYNLVTSKDHNIPKYLSKEDKLTEFLNIIEQRQQRINADSKLKFSDGTLLISFVNGYRKYIYSEIEKEENMQKYPKACEIMDHQRQDQRRRYPKMNIEDMLKEYISEVEKQGCVINKKGADKFSNGALMYYFWYTNIQNIYYYINSFDNNIKYPKALKLINQEYEKYLSRLFRKIDRINIRKQREMIYKVCEDNNIDININKETLDHILYKEFVSKLNFLKMNNCDIMDNEGCLDHIFNISNKHLKVFYDIYIDELIYKYFNVKMHQKVR